jgi:hypothetical protein
MYFRRRTQADRSGGRTRKREGTGRGAPAGGWLNRRTLAFGVAALVIGSAVVYLVIFAPPSPGTDVVTYCGGEGTAAHYHPLLVIDVDGTQQPLPYDQGQSADIGYIDSPGYTNASLYCPTSAVGPGIHALHTHDGSGIIHAELPPNVRGTPTLEDFFEIWGEPLSSSSVWTYSGSVRATVLDSDTHRTTDYSSNPGSIPLYASAAGPTANPYPIPQSLIFNGKYGEGESGGTFSGEVIWLNVTSGGTVAMMAHSCDCNVASCWRDNRQRHSESALPAHESSGSHRLMSSQTRSIVNGPVTCLSTKFSRSPRPMDCRLSVAVVSAARK